MRRALLRLLRATRLIGLADGLVARRAARKMAPANAAYRRLHSNRRFPDPTLVFEVAGHASLEAFDASGARDAMLIAEQLRAAGMPAAPRVLEWGAGPARILAHMQAALGAEARLHACDPDPRAIAFIASAHPTIALAQIARIPPTPYNSGAFDAIYGISIFTHLSEAAAASWARELARLTAPSGCVLVTSHGARAAVSLSAQQRLAFDSGAFIALGGAPMGSRTFASYFNEARGRRLFAPHFDEISFAAAAPERFGQDLWLLRRPRAA